MLIRSLRWQIQAWHTLLLVAIVSGLLTAFYYYERKVQLRFLDEELRNPVHALLPHFDLPPEMSGAERGEREGRPRPGGEAGGRAESRGFKRLKTYEEEGGYVVFWKEDILHYRTEGSPEPLSLPSIKKHPRIDEHSSRYRWNGEYREFTQPTPRGWLVVGRSVDVLNERMATFRWKLISVGSAFILGGFLVGWMMANRAMKPIEKMSMTAMQIADGDLSRRIDVAETTNELGDLARVLNATFGRLDTAFEQQVRFTADASHEMRTPLAVIMAKSELALARERSVEKYQDTIQTCYDSANHMRALIESLLELSKVDSGEFSVSKLEGDFTECVRGCVDMLEPLAAQRGIRMDTDFDLINATFDYQRMRQVCINLLSNAVKYNVDNGKIGVSVKCVGDWVQVKVSDTGPGIGEEDLKYVFDRFYKIDKSRKVKEGSTGLGLAISKAIVEAHGGEIRMESVLGEGSSFIVLLPRNV